MSLSHLNLSVDPDKPAEMDPKVLKTRKDIHQKKMNEHYDYSRFKNTDDITKVSGTLNSIKIPS